MRVDIFGIRTGNGIDGALTAPLRPDVPALVAGGEYLVEVVLRTLTLGHVFTQGTADSNEVWLEVRAMSGGRIIGISGGRDPADAASIPGRTSSTPYVLDRDGNRIDRRNAEDIFTPLYNHQIPPGAASVAHYRLRVPDDLDAPLTVTARLHYRKFDTLYLRLFQGEAFAGNTLPVVTIASDKVEFPITATAEQAAPDAPAWQRWNDYGIGLLAKPDRGALKQAEAAFRQVAGLGRAEGDLNRARVLIREGRLDEAAAALRQAAANGAYPWSVAWFGGLVDLQNGEFDSAIAAFTGLVETRFGEARQRGFDLLQGLQAAEHPRPDSVRAGQGLRAAPRTGGLAASPRHALSRSARPRPENVTAHYGLAQVSARLGDEEAEGRHRRCTTGTAPTTTPRTAPSPPRDVATPRPTTPRKRWSYTIFTDPTRSDSATRDHEPTEGGRRASRDGAALRADG